MESKRKYVSHHYSPLRYPGGKACIYPFVTKFMQENELIGTAYAEPYAGGSGLALKLLMNEFVSHIYINDFDYSIYCFWKVVLDSPVLFCDWLEDVQVTPSNWEFYKDIQRNQLHADPFEIAKSTYFLNRTNVSGVLKGGMIGGMEQKGKYKINARFNKKDLISRIERIAKFRNRISISNKDGLNFINQLDKKREDIFIYLDPPYYQKGADLYMNFFADKDHQKLSKRVFNLSKKWMVSYDNHEFILNLYKGQKKVLYQLSQSASNRIGDEIVIFSDELIFNESMSHLKSATSLGTMN